MILTENDRSIYFPNLHLEGDSLTGAIKRAQITAEALGSNRSLELVNYSSLVRVNATNTFQLPYVPIAPDPAPSYQARRSSLTGDFGRVYPAISWNPIDPLVVNLDYSTGYGFINDVRYTQLKVNYASGFNFDIESQETIDLKFALASLLIFLESLPGKGIEEYRSAGVKYRPRSSDIPDYLLIPFRKYLPRSF